MKFFQKNLRNLVIGALFLAVAFVGITFFQIYSGVKVACVQAKNEFGQDCVNSLISLIQSDSHTLRQKNTAVWALGQIADKQALPFLYQLNNSLADQDRCDHDKFLCKYEIQKAIRWCERGNITNWMYQNQNRW